MYRRKLGHGEGMAHGDRQVLEPFPFQGVLEIVRGVQLAELSLDGDLPGCRRAHEDRPARIGDVLARPAGDRRRIVQPPEQDVRVEQQHVQSTRPANAASTAAGNSSKSSAILTCPRHCPPRRGAPLRSYGTSLATGSPALPMTA